MKAQQFTRVVRNPFVQGAEALTGFEQKLLSLVVVDGCIVVDIRCSMYKEFGFATRHRVGNAYGPRPVQEVVVLLVGLLV